MRGWVIAFRRAARRVVGEGDAARGPCGRAPPRRRGSPAPNASTSAAQPVRPGSDDLARQRVRVDDRHAARPAAARPTVLLPEAMPPVSPKRCTPSLSPGAPVPRVHRFSSGAPACQVGRSVARTFRSNELRSIHSLPRRCENSRALAPPPLRADGRCRGGASCRRPRRRSWRRAGRPPWRSGRAATRRPRGARWRRSGRGSSSSSSTRRAASRRRTAGPAIPARRRRRRRRLRRRLWRTRRPRSGATSAASSPTSSTSRRSAWVSPRASPASTRTPRTASSRRSRRRRTISCAPASTA